MWDHGKLLQNAPVGISVRFSKRAGPKVHIEQKGCYVKSKEWSKVKKLSLTRAYFSYNLSYGHRNHQLFQKPNCTWDLF